VHVADSLVLVPHLRASVPRRGVDLGAGGGLPGLVLACALPEAQWLLVDSTRKKVEALERMAAAIGLTNVAAAWGRAEQLAGDPSCRAQFDVVTARAVADLPALIAYAAPLLHTGGAAWFYKTTAALEREFPKAGAAALRHNMEWRATHEYTLPGEVPGRALVCYERL
jgi:16S rRNA (guanine527-N7)-methyltransferase